MFGTKTVVGLDVGSHTVKAVALTPNRDRVTLSGFAQARIGSQDPAMVVRQVIDQLGVKPKHLVTAVSGRSVIVRQVETPRLQGEELKAHISYEADKYIPFGTDEVIIDCQPLPGGNATDSNQQVLLVAVRRGFVEDHLNMLRSAGLHPEIIDVDVFAIANAYELFGPGLGSEGDATALIDIGGSKSNIAIVQGDRLLFTREVYLAGNEVTDAIVRTFNEPQEEIERIKSAPGDALEALIDAAMPAFEDLANEIRLSFDYVEGQFEKQVGAVVLTGGTSLLPSIADILGNILGRPVQVFDPLAGLDLVPSRYDIHGLDASAPALTIALGLAAHLLEGKVGTGLGGSQSHNWQPRSDAGATRSLPAQGDAPEAGDPTDAPAPIAPPDDNPLPMPASTPTPYPPPAQAFAPPPEPDLLTPPPPAATEIAPPPTEEPPRQVASTEFFNTDQNKSGLLVILDDDQDMPASERVQKGTGTHKQTIKLDNFEDDEPDLPKLPKI